MYLKTLENSLAPHTLESFKTQFSVVNELVRVATIVQATEPSRRESVLQVWSIEFVSYSLESLLTTNKYPIVLQTTLKSLRETLSFPLCLPIRPNIELDGIQIKGSRCLKSKKSPILVSFTLSRSQNTSNNGDNQVGWALRSHQLAASHLFKAYITVGSGLSMNTDGHTRSYSQSRRRLAAGSPGLKCISNCSESVEGKGA